MKYSIDTFSKKITLLNQTILESMMEKDAKAIIKNFTETSIKVLNADFGFAWWKFKENKEYRLAYKSRNTPYNPTLPRERAGNYIAQKTKKPFFDSNVNKENYEFDIERYLKSYIIIPIYYKDFIYGNLVLCYKKPHNFSKDELILSEAVGNSTAQAITVHQLVEISILLDQEKVKTEFIANATHELRTPLAIMKGNIDLALLNKGDSKSTRDALEDVNTEIDILSDILKDLTILTTSGKNVISSTPINIRTLLTQIVKRIKIVAKKRNITIKIKPAQTENLQILGDINYLEKLFLNIIKNAIAYGKDQGNISIEIKGDKNMVTVKISDDGIGISEEDLPKIFERFYRADKSHTSSGKSTGLGLAIAKWAAEAHGGQISVKSSLKKGSIFTISLPKK